MKDKKILNKKDIKKGSFNDRNCPDFDNLYKNIAENITGGVWVAEKNNTVCYVNRGMSDIAGIPTKNFLGLNVMKDFSESTLKFFRPYYLKAKKEKIKVKYEKIPVITPDKRKTYQSGWLIPILKNKKLEGIICTVDDVTKEEEYRKKINERNDFLGKVINSFPYPFYVIDAKNYKIKEINTKAGKMTGKLKNPRCFEVSHGAKKPCAGSHPCPLDIVIKTGKPTVLEHIHFNEKGEKILVEVHGYPVFNEKGKITEMIEYSIDMTEKKRAEEEIKNRVKELEKINSLMIGRELKMIELKKEIKELKGKK